MDNGPLVREEIDAAARFLSRFDKHFPVRAAFWLKRSETGLWHLCIVSDVITDENFDRAYAEVIRLADELQDPAFNALRVKVLWPQKPLAQAVLEARQRYPGKAPIHLSNTFFGGVDAEEVYIYGQPVTVP
jgi:hypothetical protein